MRNFHPLDQVSSDLDSGILLFTSSVAAPFKPQVALKREGSYVAFSVSHGPMEMALRPRVDELKRVLGRVTPVVGLQTTRQVGTSDAYIAIGLNPDGTLLIRPTLVADATGHFCFNLMLSDAMRAALFEWLGVVREAE
ncbi:MAG: hypothetical protein MUC99_08170 [Anaerolineae bacterium]|jgi:hypothetical protein|nr:hypothetical protein [Anaerolineae bacterium]